MPAQTLKAIENHLESIESLGSVVSTMKSLATVNIRHFEEAAAAADRFYENIRLALQVLMMNKPSDVRFSESDSSHHILISIGSDQGMVGQFNEAVAEKTNKLLMELKESYPESTPHLFNMGYRIGTSIHSFGLSSEEEIPIAGTLNEAVDAVKDVLELISSKSDRIMPVRLVNNRPEGGSSYVTESSRVLPLGRHILEQLAQRPWKGRSIPMTRYSWSSLFENLSREYLFITLYSAVVQSLASENAARLAAMQAAEKNIDEKKEEVRTLYNQKRQSSITEELLDIVGGFEALSN